MPFPVADSDSRHERYVELLNRHQSRLFAYLYAHVLNMADAEDLYQQVALVLWEKFDQFEPGTEFGAWAIRVAELTVRNYARGQRRGRRLFSDEVMQRLVDRQSEISEATFNARTDALHKCLERLASLDRELVERCYGSDYKIKDVAKHAGRSVGAVYTALCRIRQSLMTCIERTMAAEARS